MKIHIFKSYSCEKSVGTPFLCVPAPLHPCHFYTINIILQLMTTNALRTHDFCSATSIEHKLFDSCCRHCLFVYWKKAFLSIRCSRCIVNGVYRPTQLCGTTMKCNQRWNNDALKNIKVWCLSLQPIPCSLNCKLSKCLLLKLFHVQENSVKWNIFRKLVTKNPVTGPRSCSKNQRIVQHHGLCHATAQFGIPDYFIQTLWAMI